MNTDPKIVHASLEANLMYDRAVSVQDASDRDKLEALVSSVRDVIVPAWLKTEMKYREENVKRVYYISMEFLVGRSLRNNLVNMKVSDVWRERCTANDFPLDQIVEQEHDAGLGNGGLGRLAACFLDSLATLEMPAMGYGLRYQYGIFRQELDNGWQHETPDRWLERPDRFEVSRPDEAVEVPLACSFDIIDGQLHPIGGQPSVIRGVPFDRPVVGFGGRTVNTLRLWAAESPDGFDFHRFSSGDFVGSLSKVLTAESLTRVLYPDDSTNRGKALRFLQEYFLVSCSVQDSVRRFRKQGNSWDLLPEKLAMQLNDTHPAMAVPELMRVLLDQAHLNFDDAFEITKKCLAYTNHTLLPEALEVWPVEWFEAMLPRLLEIIYQINERVLTEARTRFAGDDYKVKQVSLVGESWTKTIRMGNLAVAGTHSTNGVAAIHTGLLKERVMPEFAELYPERFNNKTNGVTPRRWVRLANPGLSELVSSRIGEEWVTNLLELEKLKPLAKDNQFHEHLANVKLKSKQSLNTWLKANMGLNIAEDRIIDCQIKRIHEYKRQLLNALHIASLYVRIKEDSSFAMQPRTFVFGGKAAPAYEAAKLIIKLINSIADVVNKDPHVSKFINILFIPNYNVTVAEKLIPATDVSEQISTAGFEASGTGNMKFMLNGALTIGTRDGATIEMAEQAGEDNFYIFGLDARQVQETSEWYNPRWHYEQEDLIKQTLDLISSDYFNKAEPGIFSPLINKLLNEGDKYMHLADFSSYVEAHLRIDQEYNTSTWWEKVVKNISAGGFFSSDRTIKQYCDEIWEIEPCVVS